MRAAIASSDVPAALAPARRSGPASARGAPGRTSLEPCTPAELRALVHGGENDSDAVERVLASVAREAGAVDLAIGDGLAALAVGHRLISLGFSRVRDYAREVLGIRERTTQAMIRLSRELRRRPLLRAAVRSGQVRPRHAQTVLRVAVGDDEAAWVERARHETVRSLEAAVREALGAADQDEDWVRFRVRLAPEGRELLDEALSVAGRILPGSSRAERLEAMAQEYVAEHPVEAGDDGADPAGGSFRPWPDGSRALEERLERETDGWAFLDAAPGVPSPPIAQEDLSADDLDAALRALAARRDAWDDLLGWCAYAVRRSGLWRTAGFASFGQYCAERLGLSARAVEQRAALERRLWQVPALRSARDAGVSYEKIRLLSRLADGEIGAWVPRALQLTCVDLREAIGAHDEAQMRAARALRAPVPERTARLLRSAFRAVRAVEGRLLDDGRCLVEVARHFVATWKAHLKRPTLSQRIRERDLGRCRVPGCSGRAVHAHHLQPRSRGGSDDEWNLVSLCACHHLLGIHGGYLRVRGTAPDALLWELAPRGPRGPMPFRPGSTLA